MSFVNELKKFAIARLKQRRHRQTVMYLEFAAARTAQGHRLDRRQAPLRLTAHGWSSMALGGEGWGGFEERKSPSDIGGRQ